jgi:acyl carrier protein
MKHQVLEIICNCLRDLNTVYNSPDLENPTGQTRLIGAKSSLDSVGLVNLIADIEESISRQFGKEVVLADERAMSRSHSPFRHVEALAELVVERLEELEQNGKSNA